MAPIVAVTPTDPALGRLLGSHPEVRLAGEPTPGPLVFEQSGWKRRLSIGDGHDEVRGLVELMDNNPLVCADSASVPTAADTLGLIALGPVFLAGLALEPPVLQTNAPGATPAGYWSTVGWQGGVETTVEDVATGSVYAAQAIVAIQNPSSWSEIDSLYEECFGRSFYVRRAEDGDWDTALVAGRPWAAYRLRMTPGEGTSLLTVQVMAEKDGKCGAAQVVHAMNVMAGFEETLGIPESFGV